VSTGLTSPGHATPWFGYSPSTGAGAESTIVSHRDARCPHRHAPHTRCLLIVPIPDPTVLSFPFRASPSTGFLSASTFISSRKMNRSIRLADLFHFREMLHRRHLSLLSILCETPSVTRHRPTWDGNPSCRVSMGSRSSKPESRYDKGRSARDRRKLFETCGFYPPLSLSRCPFRATVELSVSSSAVEWYSTF